MSSPLFDSMKAIYIANISIASLLICGFALVATMVARRRSLPLQYALLSVAVSLMLICPLAVWVASSHGVGVVSMKLSMSESVVGTQVNDHVVATAPSSHISQLKDPADATLQDAVHRKVTLSSEHEGFAVVSEAPNANSNVVMRLLVFAWVIGSAVALIRFVRGMLVVLHPHHFRWGCGTRSLWSHKDYRKS